jgi:hypothetical protein
MLHETIREPGEIRRSGHESPARIGNACKSARVFAQLLWTRGLIAPWLVCLAGHSTNYECQS